MSIIVEDEPKIKSSDVCSALKTRVSKLPKKTQIVLGLLQAGHSNKVIGAHLEMPESTVKCHVTTILRSLGCHNRTQACLIGLCVTHDLSAPLLRLIEQQTPPRLLKKISGSDAVFNRTNISAYSE